MGERDGATVRRLADASRGEHITPRLRDDPVSIETVERRRAHLWIVAALLLLALSSAIILLFVGRDVVDVLPELPALRWSFLALSFAFILYVVDQERRLRSLTAALIEERVLSAGLQARIADLATLTKVGRVVNSVLTLEEVLEVILTSVFELTGATNGSVMLRDGDLLRVAASTGDRPAPAGVDLPLGSGVAGWVAEQREPLLITGRLGGRQFPGRVADAGGSSVVAPLVAGGELLGVLAVERSSASSPFTETELRSVALFAEHAATAVSNAYRYDEERRAVAELADVLEKRAEFVATMVHELKNPLTVILGFASVLSARWSELSHERRAEALDVIRDQAQRLRSMVDEVLRTASVEAGADLRRDPVDLAPMLHGLLGSTAAMSGEHQGVERPVTFDGGDRPAVVLGDAEALYRVFSNILDNAVKYSPAGSPIHVALERDDDQFRVRIRDEGPGIPADEIDTVFERFRRSDPTVAAGVGLGLYIVRVLVQSHGGRVWASSSPGAGATFTVALPAYAAATAETPADARHR